MKTRHRRCAIVRRCRHSGFAVAKDARPHEIAISVYDSVSISVFAYLVRKQRRVNAAEYDTRPARAREPADGIPAEGVSCVDTDPHSVARCDAGNVKGLQCIVRD